MWVGVLLFLGGLLAYFVEYGVFHVLRTPYIFLIPASLSSVILIRAVITDRVFARSAVAVVVTGLTLMVWWLALVAWRTPIYTGPAAVGEQAPAFRTTSLNGSTFDTASLRGDSHSLLIFYRGRW